MRHWKPFTLPAIRLAALIVLLAASGGLARAQSPSPAANPTVAGDRANSDNRCRGRHPRHSATDPHPVRLALGCLRRERVGTGRAGIRGLALASSACPIAPETSV